MCCVGQPGGAWAGHGRAVVVELWNKCLRYAWGLGLFAGGVAAQEASHHLLCSYVGF